MRRGRRFLIAILQILYFGIFPNAAFGQETKNVSPSINPIASPPAISVEAQMEQWRRDYEQEQVNNPKFSRYQNFNRYAAYVIMRPYLPSGTKFTSGFRSQEDQVEVIRRFAQRFGITVPANARPDDENSWGPALAKLRANGFIIASPKTTPHSSEYAVFDLGGASLDAIEKAVYRTQEIGLIKLRKVIPEEINHCIHVEVEYLSTKAITILGTGSALSSNQQQQAPGGNDGSQEQEQRGYLYNYLTEQHSKESNPNKKIELDEVRMKLLDLSDPQYQTKLSLLNGDIAQNKQTIEELKTQTEKRNALNAISEAGSKGNYRQALELARAFTQNYPGDPEAQNREMKLEAWCLFVEATDIAIDSRWDCDQCKVAQNKIEESLDKSQNAKYPIQGIPKFKNDLELHLRYCTRAYFIKIFLGGLLLIGLLIVLYFILRPTQWILEGVAGPCQGEIYSISKEEVLIGAIGPPDGTADIVISDSRRKISRLHCVIRQVGRKYYLKDQSANGTKINGIKLAKDDFYRLRKGDEISLADVAEFIFRPE